MVKLGRAMAVVTPSAFGVAGLWLAMYPTFFSRFERLQYDGGDTRFITYVLEHSFRWLTQAPWHEEFWSPPFFFPARNVAAYSETLLGVAPFYWLWRAWGLLPDTSFQLWTVTLLAINFGVAYWVFQRAFSLSRVGASVAAFLFAFGAPRLNQLGHQQLLAHFFSLGALHTTVRIFSAEPSSERGRKLWIYCLSFFVAAQLYSCVYLGFFLVLALGVAALWAVLIPACRQSFTDRLRLYLPTWIGAGLALGVLLAPFFWHYLSARHDLGERSFGEVWTMIPRWRSWLDLGPGSWLYGWLWRSGFFGALPMEHEHRLGVGFLTLCVAGVGLYSQRNRRPVQLVVATVLCLVVLSMMARGMSAWELVFRYVPAGGAIRAVSRIGLLALLPVALGVGQFLDRGLASSRALVALPLVLLCLAEQGMSQPSVDRQAYRERASRLAREVGPACQSFLYAPTGPTESSETYQLDAMSASLERDLPTVNGYAGSLPPDWDFEVTDDADNTDARLTAAVSSWEATHGLSPGQVCLVRIAAPPGIE